MQLFHRSTQALIDEQRKDSNCFINIALDWSRDVAQRMLEHMSGNLVLVARVPNSKAQAHEIAATMPDDITNAVMTTVTAALFQPDRTRWQIDLVMGNQHLLRLQSVVVQCGANRTTTQIHVALWFDQPYRVTINMDAAAVGIKFLLITKVAAVFSCQRIDAPESGVVQGFLVLVFGVTEAGDNS